MESTAGEETLSDEKNHIGIFLADVISPLLFIKAMMTFHHILMKYTGGYKLTESQEKINPGININDIKLFAMTEKELETLVLTISIYHQDIRMGFGIKMYYTCVDLQKTTNDGRNRTTKSRKSQNSLRKGNLQVLRNIGSGHHQASRDERKKTVFQAIEKTYGISKRLTSEILLKINKRKP